MKNSLYPYVYDLVLVYHYRWSFKTAIDSMEIWKVKLQAGNEVPEYWLYQVDIGKRLVWAKRRWNESRNDVLSGRHTRLKELSSLGLLKSKMINLIG